MNAKRKAALCVLAAALAVVGCAAPQPKVVESAQIDRMTTTASEAVTELLTTEKYAACDFAPDWEESARKDIEERGAQWRAMRRAVLELIRRKPDAVDWTYLQWRNVFERIIPKETELLALYGC